MDEGKLTSENMPFQMFISREGLATICTEHHFEYKAMEAREIGRGNMLTGQQWAVTTKYQKDSAGNGPLTHDRLGQYQGGEEPSTSRIARTGRSKVWLQQTAEASTK